MTPTTATINDRIYNGLTLTFQGGIWPMPIDDLQAFKKYWNIP